MNNDSQKNVMVDIIFYVDWEPGHIIPTFKLADSLIKSGYSVCYIGLSRSREIVEKTGFTYYEMYENLDIDFNSKNQEYYSRLLNDKTNDRIHQLNPKLIITNHFLILDTLIFYYKYKNIKQIVLYTHLLWLKDPITLKELCFRSLCELTAGPLSAMIDFLSRNEISYQGLDDIIAPIENIPEFLLCAKEFEINEVVEKDKKRRYLGPGILEEKASSSFFEDHNIPENKKLIYASMGSQAKSSPEKAKHFFNQMIACMQSPSLGSFYLIMTVGSNREKWELNNPSNNVSIHSWVPQKIILKKSVIAIIHGGLNTIKEAIFYGTPMIVFPMGRDQGDNAHRVVYHEIGVEDVIDTMNIESLSKNIIKVVGSATIQNSIKKMSTLFKEQNQRNDGVKFIREHLNTT
ncbi:glycosyltransferase [Ascidiimonas sp. W6]|uniref:glycosyltransferase n=1 Tax=Ascidiimonas meishanensis TaxID=3128903 RepID=UPI0030EE7ABC